MIVNQSPINFTAACKPPHLQTTPEVICRQGHLQARICYNMIIQKITKETAMENPIFRKKSLDRISSPEALDDYLHVTTPAVWLILIAIIMLLVGMLIWSHVASIDSFATGSAQVKDGEMYIEFDNEQIARNVQSGMTVIAGETQSRISSVGVDSRGNIFAQAPTELADGYYVVDVLFKQTQVIHLLFN